VSRALQLLGAVVVALVLTVVCVRLWRVNTSIVAFLPAGDDRELFEVTKALADSTATRQMILSLGLPGEGAGALEPKDRAALADAAARLGDALRTSPRVLRVRQGVEEAAEQALWTLYQPRRYHFWSKEPERELPEALSDEGLSRAAEDLKAALAGPEGPLARTLAPSDPWLLFRAFLGRLEASRPPEIEAFAGQLFSRDGRAVLFVELADSPFDGERQRELLAHLERAVSALPPIGGRALELEATGVNRFAVASEAVVRADLNRISLLSVGGFLFLFGLLLRRPARLLVTFLPLAAGVLVAMTFSLVAFGELHVLTLAFGSALIGVGIDYPVHLVHHHDLAAPTTSPTDTLRAVWPSLLLAGSTTTAGLLGLGLAGFPGLREMAAFACAGIVGALAATLWLGKSLGQAGRATALQRALAERLGRGFDGARQKRGAARSAFSILAVLGVLGLTGLRWRDDLGALNVPTPELLEVDQRVRERVGQGGGSRYVVALGRDWEEALQRSERAAAELERLVAQGDLGRYTTVSGLVRSRSLQERNLAALRAAPDLVPRALAALEHAGFVPELFAPFAEELGALLRGTGSPPLLLEDLRGGPLRDLVDPFLVELHGKEGVTRSAAIVSPLGDVRRPAAVAQALEPLPGVHYFDQRAALDVLSRDVRSRTLWLLGLGMGAMLVLSLVRYRSPRRAAGVVLPAWVSGAVTLSFLSVCGVELNLLHVVALLLVLSMGVDYGIFLVDTERTRATPAALLSILLACLSTMLSFGLLALSSMPALRAIGQTVAVGVLANVLLAPLAAIAWGPRLVVANREPERHVEEGSG
jgi:predicted exporter